MTANSTESLNPAVTAHDPSLANGPAWREIDRLLEELATLAKTDCPRKVFYTALLEGAITALGASGGAVWSMVDGDSMTLLAHVNYGPSPQGQELARLLSGSLEPALTRIFPPHACEGACRSSGQTRGIPLLVCRMLDHQRRATIIALELPTIAAPEFHCGADELFNVFREVAIDFEQLQELKGLRLREAGRQQLQDLELRWHDSLEPVPTAYAVANDGRLWIGCDRVSVVETVQGRAKLLAVSGVDGINRGSADVRALQALATAVAASGDSLIWTEGSTPDLLPQIDQAREAYLDLVPVRRLAVRPLQWRGNAASTEHGGPRALLIAECYDECLPENQFQERVNDVARHGGAALLAALAHHDLPLVPVQLKLARLLRLIGQRRIAWLLGLAVITAVGGLLAIVPARFSVEARGTLEPAVRRHLFAPADGIVERVMATHGQQVARDAPVLVLRDPRLDLDYSRVGGELQTARARLDSVQANRSRRSSAPDVREEDRQLAAEEEQLREQVRGLESQLRLFSELRDSLHVTSPIDGVVLTWNADDLLRDRPVKQGQLLVTVADTTGPWVLELKLPDADVGHVLKAQRAVANDLPVSFLLATDPAKTHRGALERVALATIAADGDSPTAHATVRIEGAVPRDARAGAGVTARIDCGTRSIGYVWLHDLIDFIRTQVLF